MFDGLKENYEVENRENPIGGLPQALRHAYVYGDPNELNDAIEKLEAWSQETGRPILNAEWGFLEDARAMLGYNSRNARKMRERQNPVVIDQNSNDAKPNLGKRLYRKIRKS